ncbi:MAG: MgtC/SapB family protein [Planctomycetes bacterium]|nr:MgtC/SapB family protein [Planctomycetota bacterium]
MDPPDTWSEILVRPAVAMLCGAILGWEREIHRKPAGLRTHMMVALGAAAFTLTTLILFHSVGGADTQGVDPLRVVSGVIGGIGFLGAGSIIQARGAVRGVTTAATIWVVGAVGLACGAGYYKIAGVVVLYSLIILVVVGFIENRLGLTDDARVVDDSQPETERSVPPSIRTGDD